MLVIASSVGGTYGPVLLRSNPEVDDEVGTLGMAKVVAEGTVKTNVCETLKIGGLGNQYRVWIEVDDPGDAGQPADICLADGRLEQPQCKEEVNATCSERRPPQIRTPERLATDLPLPPDFSVVPSETLCATCRYPFY